MQEPDPSKSNGAPVPLGYETPDPERPASSAPAFLDSHAPGTGGRGHDPYAALRYPDFLLYLAGWVLSVIGQQIQDVAVGWDIFIRTRAEANINPLLALGLVGAVLAIPIIVLAIPAGALADRFDRRKIIMISVTGAAACSLGLAWLSHVHGSLTLMYVSLFAGSTFSAMGWPARSALLPQTVPTEIFSNAVTWNSSAFQIASMVGPALGGLILYWSIPLAYVMDAAFLLAFAVFLMFLRVNSPPRKREPVTFENVIAGVRFVIRNKIILATITLDLFAVLLGGATALLPAFAKDILHVSSGGFGVLRAAPAIGALAMGLIIAHLPPMKRAGRNLLIAVAGFGVATIVFGLSKNFTLSFIMLLLTGVFDNVSVVVRHTLVQVLTPDAMRGRVSAVNNIFVGASNELGGFESGLTGAWLGAVRSVVLGGIGTLGVVVAVAIAWPQVMRFGSLQDAKAIEE
ncbi:MAG TPA: MFS transporter [Tepidisphaeraceae bacterium]|jgi:MFS family permease|nr:MFS transporter [Tepidisphaeraceae bacterium]